MSELQDLNNRVAELELALAAVGDMAVADWNDPAVGIVDKAVPVEKQITYKDGLRTLFKAGARPDFANPTLVTKYGSWMRVQVAFYDFLFRTASDLCVPHWKELMLKEIADQFNDGADLYERTVTWIEQNLDSPETAWSRFLDSHE